MASPKKQVPKPILKKESGSSTLDLSELDVIQAKEAEILAESEDSEYKEDDKYNIFDYENFLEGLNIHKDDLRAAKKYVDAGRVSVDSIEYGYATNAGNPVLVGNAECSVFVDNRFNSKFMDRLRVFIRFTTNRILNTDCSMYSCYKVMDYKSYLGVTVCEHIIAAIIKLQEELAKGVNIDATSIEGYSLLSALFQEDLEKESAGKVLNLRPTLSISEQGYELFFKVGEKKLYKVKNINDFFDTLLSNKEMKFGSKTTIRLGYDRLNDKSAMWADFIRDVLMADSMQMSYMEDRTSSRRSSWYYNQPTIKDIAGTIRIFGAYLDDFYTCAMKDGDVDFEYHFSPEEKPVTGKLVLKEGDINLKLEIHKDIDSNTNIIHGIKLTGAAPTIEKGHNYAYYFDKDSLYRVDSEKTDQLLPILAASKDNRIDIKIGRNHLAKFYHDTLPKLKKIADITEYDHEEMARYIPPAPEFMCFLDLVDNKVLCKPTVNYGIQRFSVTDWFESSPNFKGKASFRSRADETMLLSKVIKYIPDYYSDEDILVGEKDDDGIYELLDHGLEELMEVSEVRVTDRFKRINVVSRAKFSMGVSVDSNIMDLEISSDELTKEELLDILFHYNLKRKFIRLKNGDFFKLEDNEAVGRLAQMMETLHISPSEFVKGKMHIPAYRALYLDKMLEKSQDIYTDRDQHYKTLVKEFKTVEDADFELPDSLKHVLRNYQKSGYRWLRTLDKYGFGGILADEMGLGKTLQTIAVLLAKKIENEGNANVDNECPSLIVCPASLVYNWGEELKKYAPKLKVALISGSAAERKKQIKSANKNDVLVTSYDLLKRDIDLYENVKFDFQIIDEAQYIKNHNTAAAKTVKVINAGTRFALTGTPIENRLSELWSIFDYLMPGFLYGSEDFRNNYETRIVKQDDQESMEKLRKMVAPFILRRLKEDVLTDLPEKLEETRFAVMEDKQRKLYDGQVVKMKKLLESQSDSEFSRNKLQVLSEITRIRQICCDPSLCFENYDGESAKRKACMELIDSLMDGGHKALIFSQFTSMLEMLEKDLIAAGISFYKITGSTPKEKRVELVEKFNNNDVPIFLISLKAGGTGLNLTGADVVIHYDPWWNVAAQNQATDRAHRIGQKSVVTVYKLIIKNTIEEKILQMQEAKKKLADDILSSDGIASSAINRDELLELLV